MSISRAPNSGQPPLGGPPGQLMPRRQLQLAQHRGHVAFHRLHRDVKLPGDLLVRVPLRDQPQHFPLARGQLVKLGIKGRPDPRSPGRTRSTRSTRRTGSLSSRCGEGIKHEPRQPVREHRVARRDPADRVGKLRGGDRLRHVATRARPDHRDHVLGRVGGGKREKAHLRMRGLDRLDHGLAAAARQVHVEQHHIGPQRGDQLDRGLHVVRLAHDVDLPAKLGADPGPEQPVIVDKHHPRSAHFRPTGCAAERGMVSVTLVPSPWTEFRITEPPRRVIRPCTDSARPLRSSGTAAGSNPFPRSRTTIDTSPASTSAHKEITPAPDHFAALTVASLAAPSSAFRLSSSPQSPTVTASTGTPCLASTSCWICRTPPANVRFSSISPGARPSNSHERSSRSCIRASWTTFCGSSARRWIRASVCNTESCTRAAMSARSSARTLAWRSCARSRAIRTHQGPRNATTAAITSTTPTTGRTAVTLAFGVNSATTPPISSTTAIVIRI